MRHNGSARKERGERGKEADKSNNGQKLPAFADSDYTSEKLSKLQVG